MRALWLTVLLVGCSGKDDEGDAVLPDDTDEPGGGPEERCEGIPSYNVAGMTCAQLGTAFEDLVDEADRCTIDANCRVLGPMCADWNQVTCYYVTNDCILDLKPEPPEPASPFPTIEEFLDESVGCATTQVCDCQGSPPVAKCIEGRCELEYDYTY